MWSSSVEALLIRPTNIASKTRRVVRLISPVPGATLENNRQQGE
jgi:hypothetical protein